jgi:hypothetical protein
VSKAASQTSSESATNLGRRDEVAHRLATHRLATRFGYGIDPVAAGRRGGIASGVSRRLKDERQLEARVFELRNGAAIYSVLRDKRARDAELKLARRQADRDLAEADLALLDATEQLAELNAQLRSLDERIAAREAELEQAAVSDPSLKELLARVGEDRVRDVAQALGWIAEDDA